MIFNKYLLVVAAAACAAAVVSYNRYAEEKKENERLAANVTAAVKQSEVYRTELGKSAATVQRLQLTKDELQEMYGDVCETAKELKVQVSRLRAASRQSTSTEVQIKTEVRDTVIWRESARADTVGVIKWSDAWISVEGSIKGRDVELDFHSVDTLTQVVHRVPKKFWFIKYGTKAIRQEVVSSNPHTSIVYTEYIELK